MRKELMTLVSRSWARYLVISKLTFSGGWNVEQVINLMGLISHCHRNSQNIGLVRTEVQVVIRSTMSLSWSGDNQGELVVVIGGRFHELADHAKLGSPVVDVVVEVV